jgi:putative ABC transport system permease protein
MEAIVRDLRLALRSLLTTPGFTLPVVLCLALSLGANSAVFSLVDAVLLRALPFRDPARVVVVWSRSGDHDHLPAAAADLVDYRHESAIFEGVAAGVTSYFNLTGNGEPERLTGARISADLFSLLGVHPLLGRGFEPREDEEGRAPVALLSHGFWQRRFGGSRAVIGERLVLNDQPYTVVGVMPPAAQLRFGAQVADLWVPLVLDRAKLQQRGLRALTVVARLRPGVSLAAARATMGVVARRFQHEYPDLYPANDWSIDLIPIQEQLVGGLRAALLVLFGAVGLVLLIACANVANLMLARATAREKEVALRTALGASRGELVRQFLVEALLLALAGGALGLLLAGWALQAVVRLNPEKLPRLDEVGLDWVGVAFTAVVAVATGLAFGIVPAFRGSRTRLHEVLKQGGRTSSVGSGRHRLRSALVVAEVALALVVLVGAGLLIKSFLRLGQVAPGFHPEGLLTFQISPPRLRYATGPQQAELARRLTEAVAGIPGVARAGLATSLPLGDIQVSLGTVIEEHPLAPGQSPLQADWHGVGPGYFQTLGIPLLSGRDFTRIDQPGAPEVAIVDQSLAAAAWPGESSIGKRIKLLRPGGDSAWISVVGLVGHVRSQALDVATGVQVYTPYAQTPLPYFSLALRTSSSDPLRLADACRAAVWSVDRNLPMEKMSTLDQALAASLTGRRTYALLLSLFAGVALILAALGVYGVMSYTIAQRVQEIGIRMALGAQPGAVLRSVVGQGMVLAGIGAALGIGLSLGSGRYLATLLYDIATTDLPTFLLVTLGLLGFAGLATWLPARKAVRVDPVTALRWE